LPVVYACIAPHGSEAIPQLASKVMLRKFRPTTVGMERMADEVKRAKPDTIVIASPHSLRLWHHIGIVIAENSSGILRASRQSRKSVTLKMKCDVGFARALLALASKRGLPVVGVNYGSAEGPASDMPMDWGTLVPLWFFARKLKRKSRIVIVTPSREILLRHNFEFGSAIADLAERSHKQIVFVASADQAHAHKKSGPYGFSRRAGDYDTMVLDLVAHSRLRSVLRLDPKLVEQAKPDSLWQMAMLAGVAEKVRLRGSVLSYQAPTYFGIMCASFQRIR
jgi:aromatic ring-opening dioxygenase LigB subunit